MCPFEGRGRCRRLSCGLWRRLWFLGRDRLEDARELDPRMSKLRLTSTDSDGYGSRQIYNCDCSWSKQYHNANHHMY